MPTTLLTMGPTHAILQNVVYAMPGQACEILSSAAVEISLDGSAWLALTGANTVGVQAAGTFLRCPGGNANITLKAL